MQVFSSEDGFPSNAQLVCRQSRLMATVALIAMSSLFVGVPAFLWYVKEMPIWLALAFASPSTLFFGSFRATFRCSNWTLAMSPDGLWLNLRSHHNHRFENAETVVFLPYDELASVSKHRAQRSSSMSDGTLSWTEVSLDLRLLCSESARLRKAIAEERVRRATRKLLGGFVTMSGRSHHVPVTMPANGLLRVMWKSRYDFMRPALGKVLDRLAQHLEVHENLISQSTADWQEMTAEQVDDEILRLVEAGDNLSAIKLLTLRSGYTLTEAKQFVDGLTERLVY